MDVQLDAAQMAELDEVGKHMPASARYCDGSDDAANEIRIAAELYETTGVPHGE